MASIQTGSYDGRYLKLSVWESEVDTPNNRSKVSWTLESIGGSHNYYSIYQWGVWINGSEIYGTENTSYSSQTFPAATGSRSGSFWVNHNADGSAGNVGFSLAGTVYYNQWNSYNGSISLTRIYRTPSYTSTNASNMTEHSVRLTGSVDTHGLSITGGGWDISVDGGATVKQYYNGGPTDKTITGLNSGTQYWYRGYVVTSGGGANSGWKSFTTKDCVVRNKISGAWKVCVPYIKINGTWKKAIPYIKVNGTWKEGIN